MSSSKTAAGGEPSRSASTIVAHTARGCHILKIDGYSLTKNVPTGEFIKSTPFTVGGYRWHLRYFPNGVDSGTADYIAIYLHLDETVAKAVKAQYQFCFADKIEEDPVELDEVDSFDSRSGWGYSKFVKREDLEESEHLKDDDSFAVRCDIILVNEFRAEETSPAFVEVPPSDMHRHLADLLQTGRGADVVFNVGGVTLTAHRWMLAARSAVFNAELFGMMKESDTGGVVHIHDMEPPVFKALLYFIYTDLFPDMTGEDDAAMVQHLLVAADRYGMERLKLICEEKLCKYIDLGSVGTILMLAEQHHCCGLKKSCFDFLSSHENGRAFVASDSFQHLNTSSPSIIKELILR